jgi:hypothetical protein
MSLSSRELRNVPLDQSSDFRLIGGTMAAVRNGLDRDRTRPGIFKSLCHRRQQRSKALVACHECDVHAERAALLLSPGGEPSEIVARPITCDGARKESRR